MGYEELNNKVHMQARVIDSGTAYASEGMYSTVGDLFRQQALKALSEFVRLNTRNVKI